MKLIDWLETLKKLSGSETHGQRYCQISINLQTEGYLQETFQN